MKIGYLGSGPLTAALARRLKASHDVLSSESAALAGVTDCSVVVVNMPSDAEVDEALFGAGRLAERLARGTILIDQSRGDPEEARRRAAVLRERGVSVVDAPVHCENLETFPETSAILCGGAADAVESVRGVLETMCPKVVYCGESGAGRTACLVVSTVAACNRMVTIECGTIGLRNGLSLTDMATVLHASSGYNNAIARVLPALATRGRTSDVALEAAVRDLKLAVELGKRSTAPMLVANLVSSMFEGAARSLGSDATIDAIARIYEAAAGVEFARAAS